MEQVISPHSFFGVAAGFSKTLCSPYFNFGFTKSLPEVHLVIPPVFNANLMSNTDRASYSYQSPNQGLNYLLS